MPRVRFRSVPCFRVTRERAYFAALYNRKDFVGLGCSQDLSALKRDGKDWHAAVPIIFAKWPCMPVAFTVSLRKVNCGSVTSVPLIPTPGEILCLVGNFP